MTSWEEPGIVHHTIALIIGYTVLNLFSLYTIKKNYPQRVFSSAIDIEH